MSSLPNAGGGWFPRRTDATGDLRAYRASVAETRSLEAGGVRYAYRSFGPEGRPPLLLVNRFRGTMDHWDPALLETLSDERHVLAFDNVGLARSTGTVPTTLAGFARGVATFIEGLGVGAVDLLGYSFGGYVAQQLTLERPELVRRLILAGTGPGYVENTPTPDRVWEVAGKAVNDAQDFLYLFFKDTPASQTAGRAYLERLELRRDAFLKEVEPAAIQAQLAAARDISTPGRSLVTRLGRITQPVLVANGDADIMVPTFRSHVLAHALPNARLVIYPDAGHGFLFQYADAFGREILEFLRP